MVQILRKREEADKEEESSFNVGMTQNDLLKTYEQLLQCGLLSVWRAYRCGAVD